LSEEEVAAMPEFVRNLKCGKQIEKGDPGCGASKFNATMCNSRNSGPVGIQDGKLNMS
jgi:hypothetical protein